MTTYRLRTPVEATLQDQALWLQDTHSSAPSFEPLTERITADVAIVGGGLTGLWTAIRLRQTHPELSVVVLEASTCGSGASGRNGGQVHSWFERLDQLSAVVGDEEALRLARASAEAIGELRQLQEDRELDLGLRLDGWVWTASSKAQEGAWDEALARGAEVGEDSYSRLSASDVAARVGPSASYVGVVEERGGSLHPGRMMRSLARWADRLGVVIHEHTPVRSITDGARARLVTDRATVDADRVLVATNIWASSIPELRKRMFVVDSEVVATAPIPDRLDALGWRGGEAICDAQQQVLYYQRTSDGRVVFGRGSGRTLFRDRVTAAFNRRPEGAPLAVAELARVYPQLADAPIEYSWTGGIDCVPSHIPQIGRLRGARSVFYAYGWNGTALAQIPACSRIIAAMLAGDDDEWGRSRLIDQPDPATLPPEPIRWIGANLVRWAVIRKNRAEIRNRRPGWFVRALIRFMPSTSEH
ncbi:MAG: FAD-dependent oxidoreductase [Microbacterium sp.]|uniref:NAD(P)/FAD-dependent oxidoreductase n=1 Tax=Microbacterium sp. TaxID=51671 RepID=UPI001AD5E113|nr:FAD-dependent oxidoreductase [Microbacterium sp.]MBN9178905.1 FAD-dependent oxidoreductase [Microbacterium sp.]